MVQFCYSNLTTTKKRVLIAFWTRMAKIKMDCNQSSQALLVYFGQIANKLSIVCSSQAKLLHVLFSVLLEQ